MKFYHCTAAFLLCFSFGHFPVYAQSAPAAAAPTQAAPDLKPMTDALNFRSDMAASVGSGAEATNAAVIRLKAQAASSGLQIDSDADFAFAAIDVGRRLIALRKPAEAEAFFQAAETSLTLVIGRTSDSAATDKAQYLQKRAAIRANYLGKLSEARADLDTALQLTPDDQRLKQMHNLLPADPAATLQNHKELPTRG